MKHTPPAKLEPEAPFGTVEELGFRELGTVSELIDCGLPRVDWLQESGVYLLTVPPAYEVGFLDLSEIAKARNVISPWEPDGLAKKWIDDARIVYIGVAGRHRPRSLRKRLREPDSVLIHGDCQADHFFINQGDSSGVEGVEGVEGLIDFGDACVGDVIWDFAFVTLWSPENLRDVLLGYGERDDLIERAHRVVPAYQLLRLLGEVSWLRRVHLPIDRQTRELAARASS